VRPRRFVTVHQQVRSDAAANDDSATANLEHGQSPLWVLAIALRVFCGFMALAWHG
jgi:hypothetical protein